MRGLYAKFAVALILITSGILLMACLIFIVETHYHFRLYQHQSASMGSDAAQLNAHFEQALVQSALWTSLGGVVLAAVVSLFAAKRLTTPLLAMKRTAMRMARGELQARTSIGGNDEMSDLGNALNHLAEQLQKQERLRQTMTADIAHELRTPLATLKSHTEAMLDGVWEPSSGRLRACHEEIERLARLVGDLEQLTMMESPHFRLTLQEEELTAIVRQSVDSVKEAFASKGVRLNVVPHPSVRMRLDRQRFGQIALNLLTNALKYTPAGGSVDVSVEADEMSVAVIVADTGIGIPADAVPYVFERFYRADPSRERATGGSGIGLAIAKTLTEAHGGSIGLTSEPGRGTEVTVRLPIT